MKILKIILWSLTAAALLLAAVTWGYILLNDGKGMKEENFTRVAGGEGYEKEANAPQEIVLEASASNQVSGYAPAFAVDGDIETYWEGNGGYPETFDVLFSKASPVRKITLRLNPIEIWGKRTMRFSVEVTPDGKSFREVVAEQDFVFDWAEGNAVELSLPEDTGEIAGVRLLFTANSGAGGGQLAEILFAEE